MAYYRVYYHATGGYRAVKQGFSWPASCFGWLWAFVSKLWEQGIIGLIVWTILVSFFDTSKNRDDTGAFRHQSDSASLRISPNWQDAAVTVRIVTGQGVRPASLSSDVLCTKEAK